MGAAMNRPGCTVLVMAGGTGGHVFPALAVAERLRAEAVNVVWMGAPDSFESRVVPQAGFSLETVEVRGLRGSGVRRLLAAPFVVTRALLRSLSIMRRVEPDAVLGLGGFVTGPGGIAAWLLRRPLLIHEQNAVTGLTNRILCRFARRVMEAFPGSFAASRQPLQTGNPVREEITQLPTPAERFATRSGPIRLLVLGGSLGAQALNERVPAAVAKLPETLRLEIRHQAGRGKDEAAQADYRRAGVEAVVTPFVDDMAEAYGWADLVICRAGALTVAELAAVGVASILVPYPHAVDDHQSANARYLSEAGAAELVAQSELTVDYLTGRLRQLLADRNQLLQMANRARGQAKPDATERVAAECLHFCRAGGEV